MKKIMQSFKRNFNKILLISLVFILSCGKEETQEKPDMWYSELGYKETMEQMKKDTQLLARRLKYEEYEEAEIIGNKISSAFKSLNFKSAVIPKEFFEYKEVFENAIVKLLAACKDKKSETVELKLKLFRNSCRDCHMMFRKELDVNNRETDYGVALERVYKDKQTK